jgi:CHAD domain-containing protein
VISPGLRGYVHQTPAGDQENDDKIAGKDPAADLLPAALAALEQAFTVAGERAAPGSGTRRRTWLDTFDWRLYRAGLVLEFEQASRGGRLVLSKADGTPQAEQPVTGWPPRRPVQDLPPGPVRDRIVVLIWPRALLPVAGAVSTVSVTRLLNEDGKTVARLIADQSTTTSAPLTLAAAAAPLTLAAGAAGLTLAAGAAPLTLAAAAAGSVVAGPAAGTTAELPLRLAVTEVRGYPAQARKAAALLAAVPGASPASQSVFIAALTALGRHPANNTNGVDAEITAPMPGPVAVARLLLRLLDTVELNVDGVLRDIDTEFLHDLRVAVRRTRSAIKLLGEVLPAEAAGHYAREFKWLGDLTTPTRDLDVHLLGFAAMTEQLLAAAPADLEPFRAFLVRRRAREFRRLAAALRSPRFRAITDDWRKALLAVCDASAPKKRRPPTAAELAFRTTGRAFARIAARGGAITPDSAPESLHDLRKRCKELRYLLEFFAPLHDPVAYRKVVGDLKQLQDCLGDFQDSQVQREEIGALAQEMLAEALAGHGTAPAATLLAMGEVAARLAVSQAEARADFARRFARFAGPAAQPRIRTLLAAPAGAGAGP